MKNRNLHKIQDNGEDDRRGGCGAERQSRGGRVARHASRLQAGHGERRTRRRSATTALPAAAAVVRERSGSAKTLDYWAEVAGSVTFVRSF